MKYNLKENTSKRWFGSHIPPGKIFKRFNILMLVNALQVPVIVNPF